MVRIAICVGRNNRSMVGRKREKCDKWRSVSLLRTSKSLTILSLVSYQSLSRENRFPQCGQVGIQLASCVKHFARIRSNLSKWVHHSSVVGYYWLPIGTIGSEKSI